MARFCFLLAADGLILTRYTTALHGDSIPDEAVDVAKNIYDGSLNYRKDQQPYYLKNLLEFRPYKLNVQQQTLRTRQDIDQRCEEAITSGFTSSAIGTRADYSSQLDDQLNLNAAILLGIDMHYPCRDAQGEKVFRLHTAQQLRQVGEDFNQFKMKLLVYANELKQQLDQALTDNDLKAVDTIHWGAAIS